MRRWQTGRFRQDLSMAQHTYAMHRSICFPAVLLLGVFWGSAGAVPVIWTGPNTTFSKTGSDSPTLPSSQDRLTDNVWLTRGGSRGLFNIAPGKETAYVQFTSPADTKWATGYMPENAGKTIAATNWEELTFIDWAPSFGGSANLQNNIKNYNAVVHLETDDIYLNLEFIDWLSGGDYTYERSTPSVAAPTGDYNGNGVVDAADYVAWRKTLNLPASPPGSGADGNSSGQVEAGDFTYWRERFGNPAGSGLGDASVPEPAGAFVLLAASLFLRRRRS
jgi:hypothetical protein